MTAEQQILTIIGSILVCGGFWTFVQFLINRHDDKKQAMKELQKAVSKLQESVDTNNTNMSLQNEALMAMAQDRIVWLGKQFLKQEWISFEDYASLKRMADAYRALGGNALVKDVMDQVDELDRR